MTEKNVLIADDDALFLRAMALRCRELGVTARTVTDGARACAEISREPPDLAVLDVNMPGHDGIAIREWMLGVPDLRHIPVVFLTGRSDRAVLEQCQGVGGEHVLKGPHAWPQLRPLICQHLGVGDSPAAAEPRPESPPKSAAQGAKILVVDDDRDVVEAIKLRLLSHGYRPLAAFSGQAAFEVALHQQPHVIITDYKMPGGSGDYLVSRLNDTMSIDIPVIVISGQTFFGRENVHLQREMTGRRHAAAFFAKPLDMALLLQTVDELSEQSILQREAARLAADAPPAA